MNDSPEKIRIVVADDHAIVRESLCRLLNSEPEMEVVGQAGNGEEACRICEDLNPDVLVLDYEMPELNGLQVTEKLHVFNSGIRILILTMYDEASFAYRLMKAGAAGFMPKRVSYSELPVAVRKVFQGDVYLTVSHDSHGPDFPASQKSTPDDSPDMTDAILNKLTPRELEVFTELAQGSKMADIAEKLFMSYSSVRTYKNRIFEKLDTDNISDLTILAMKNGLID